jgi:hypothetical protein
MTKQIAALTNMVAEDKSLLMASYLISRKLHIIKNHIWKDKTLYITSLWTFFEKTGYSENEVNS